MSDHEIESLDPDLAALFEREARSYEEDPALKARILSHVEMAVALGGPPAGGGAAPGGAPPPAADGGGSPDPGAAPNLGGAGHAGAGAATIAGAHAAGFGLRTIVAATVSAFVAGGAVGGAVVKNAMPPSPAAVHASASGENVHFAPSSVPAPAASTAPLLPPESSVTEDAGPPRATASAPRTASSASSASPNDVHGDLTRERELLDAARAAIARGRPDDAIAAAERHAQKWPRGYLVEEREAVLVQALALAGRRDEAQRRADIFRKKYPQSILLPILDSALSSPP